MEPSPPVLYTTSLDTAAKHATSAGTSYLASFTLAHCRVENFELPIGFQFFPSADCLEDVRHEPGVGGQPAEVGTGKLRDEA